MTETNDIVPPYLYHYTSVDSLAKILETGNIRFTQVDKLNDPVEGYISVHEATLNLKIPMKCAYCSCWSPNSHESVAMWQNYANYEGVRIKLPFDMFSPNGKVYICPMSNLKMRNFLYLATDIPPIIVGATNEPHGIINRIYGPAKVLYVDASEVDDGSIITLQTPYQETNDFYVFPARKVLRKVNHWEHEQEYRYFLSPISMIKGPGNKLQETLGPSINWPEFLDIPIYKTIEEVVLGPKMTQNKQLETINLLKTYGINNVYKSGIIL